MRLQQEVPTGGALPTKWLVSSTLAPLSVRYFSVGMAARMRVSSVIFRSLSSGTFRSALTCSGAQGVLTQQWCARHPVRKYSYVYQYCLNVSLDQARSRKDAVKSR